MAIANRAVVAGAGAALALCTWTTPLPVFAAEITVAGRVRFADNYALDRESVPEDPSMTGRLVVDGGTALWRFHTWVEGGWDGTVSDGEGVGVLRFDAVYQDANPFLDLKEVYIAREFCRADWRIGLQRFSWGRLDEYPINDLFNPWDYRQFIVKPMEERKIGVPAVSALLSHEDWTGQLVWVPWHVPYRLPGPGNRWSVAPMAATGENIFGLEIQPREPDLPARTVENGSFGIRLQQLGEIEWAINLFHGFDPRPVFEATPLTVTNSQTGRVIEPGYAPSFHRITAVGFDAAGIAGPLSLRGEAAYTANRVFNIRQELWGYPDTLATGAFPLHPVETASDTLDYGLAADYSPFEDGLVTLQAQQSVLFDRTPALFERTVETLLWANLKVDWLNQKVETSLNLAWNPEHGATMTRACVSYVFTDSLKAGLNALFLSGPPQSLFGRFSANDQVGLEVVYSW